MNQLSHVRGDGSAHMVDVSEKQVTKREARARALVHTRPDVIAMIADNTLPKGEALPTARIAGIQAAKRCSDLIPLCHPLPISAVSVDFEIHADTVEVLTMVRTTSRTGVEMEALTVASVAALTIYDMIKAVDKSAVITDIEVLAKSGGKSGDWKKAPGEQVVLTPGVTVETVPAETEKQDDAGAGATSALAKADALAAPRRQNGVEATSARFGAGKRAIVIISSTRAARGIYTDQTGPILHEWLTGLGYEVPDVVVVEDGNPVGQALEAALAAKVDVVITSGGTGISPTDATPQQTQPLLTQELPGIIAEIRDLGRKVTKRAALSRGVAGMAGQTFVVNLPGSPGGVRDGIEVLTPILEHLHQQLAGGGHES